MKGVLKALARKLGYTIQRAHTKNELTIDLSELDNEIIQKVIPFTMTSIARIASLLEAVRHVTVNKIPGAFVECGVWRGGSTMAALLKFKAEKDTSRMVYLYDTFEGMPAPTEVDRSFDGLAATDQLKAITEEQGAWCFASLEDVKANVATTAYPLSQVHFIKGKVEETIPRVLPESIALLRLDTDWYESTKHELEHLFPLLHPKGVLIVDDYGFWAGARKAVDEFFENKREQYYFHRIDETGRVIIRMV
jgi:O-methyltransferase